MSAGDSTCAATFRPIPGWEDWYEVSSDGQVRTKHKIGRACRKRILSLAANEKGYLRARLTKHGACITIVVHRLVLEAFVGPRPEGHECNHKDGNKANNCVGNLEWVTPKGNAKHAKDTGLWKPHIGDAHGMAIVTEADIPLIRSLEGIEPATHVAARYGVNPQTIRAIWTRRNWKHVE